MQQTSSRSSRRDSGSDCTGLTLGTKCNERHSDLLHQTSSRGSYGSHDDDEVKREKKDCGGEIDAMRWLTLHSNFTHVHKRLICEVNPLKHTTAVNPLEYILVDPALIHL